MKKGIEHPREHDQAAHMEELVHYILSHNILISSPVIFVQGWLENKIRIFTARESGELKGMTAVCVVDDPITGKTHWWESFQIGEPVNELVQQAMEIYA